MRITGAGGGAEKKQKPPVEAPNTLQTAQVARIIDVISEGETGGLVDGLKSVYLDDTPVQAEDGTFNFEGVSLVERVGAADQSYVPGFIDAENEVSIGVEVPYGSPVTRRLSNPDVDAIRVSIRWPALIDQDGKGNLNGNSASLTVEVRPNGGSFVVAVDDVFSGKTVSPYERSYRIDLEGAAPWDIRVTKRAQDANGTTSQNAMYWSRYTEIVDQRFAYPDTALAALTVQQQQFGSDVPRRSFESWGVKLQVPSNYDPAAGTYAGIWDGTFKPAVSANNAWVLYALLTHPRWGCGIEGRYVDKWSFYDAARFCDELVDDGKGGTRRRYTFNGLLNSQEDAYQVLQQVAGTFRAAIYWSSALVTIAIDRPRDPSRLVTAANVVDGMFSYTTQGLHDMMSVVQVVWNDPDDGYRSAVDVIEDAELISSIGLKVHRLAALGCTDRAQAIAQGRWFLETQKASGRAVVYVAGMDHADLTPGEVVKINDPLAGDVRAGGRVLSSSTRTVQIDAPFTMQPGETYRIAFTMETARVVGTDIAASANGSALISQTTDFVAAGFIAGNTVTVSGFGRPGNRGTCRVHDVAPRRLALGAAIEDEPAGATITIVARAVVERIVTHAYVWEQLIFVDGDPVTVDGSPLVFATRLTGPQIMVDGEGLTFNGAPVTWPGAEATTQTSLLYLDPPLDRRLPAGTVWLMTSHAPREFMVISKTEIERHQFEVAAVTYDRTKWDRIERDIFIDDPAPTGIYPVGPIPAPRDLTLREYMVRSGLGVRTAVAFSWSSPGDARIVYYEIEMRRPGQAGWQRVGVIGGLSTDVFDIESGTWAFRVRAADRLGATSPWALIEASLLGFRAPPATPTNFRSAVNGSQIMLTWTPPTDLDLAAFQIRYSPALTGATWGSAVDIVSRIPGQSTSVQVPAANGTYFLKAIDFSGVESAAAAEVIVETAAAGSINIVERLDEGPLWAGTKTGMTVNGGVLRLRPSGVMADWQPLAAAQPLSGFDRVTDGTYLFAGTVDLGETYICRVTPSVMMTLFNSRNTMSSWRPLATARPLSGTLGTEVAVAFEVSLDGGPWQSLTVGDYRARTYAVRMQVHTDRTNVGPLITQASVVIDMPDRIVSGSDVACPEVGLTVPFDPPFYTARPAVLVDAQELATGDSKAVTAINGSGFHIQFFDAANAPVARSFDYVAKGYGVRSAA